MLYYDPQKSMASMMDEVRRIGGVNTVLTPVEAKAILANVSGDIIYDAYQQKFGSDPIDPDKNYKINYNWFAELVSLTRHMAGSAETLSPTEILSELARVIFIPQGRAESVVLNNGEFESATATVVPIYQSEAASVGFGGEPFDFFTRAREMFDVPAVTAAYETAEGTSLAGTVEAAAGDWILATVTAQSAIAYPEGWTLLKETPALNADNSNQLMAFLCIQAAEAGTVTVTVGQTDAARIYLNLMAFSGIGGFETDADSGYLSNRQSNVHTATRPDGGAVVWGCSANVFGTANWECDDLPTPAVSVASAGRQANFYDAESGTQRAFQAGTSDTAAIIDYVKILAKS